MQNLAEGMSVLADQLTRLKELPNSDELRKIINEFDGMMEEVVDFIEKWLKSWSGARSIMRNGLTTESLLQPNTFLSSLTRMKLLN